MCENVMVLCILGNCGSKSGRDSIRFYFVPSIITNQGEEFEELTRLENKECFEERACL